MNETLHFLTQHGTIVLFIAVFAEQIGLPVPALLFLIAAGGLVGTRSNGVKCRSRVSGSCSLFG